ncbi:hypothetical protein VIGAN_01466300 [Vigna angularis var. angularis]|uniref:Uncharacterized protein n=1 Tax=Vigna angularis var. angularis TaxID=157739 RepID=A0A0S3R7M1_PHAAN|nr:hypothetical protein VIGAN_01466300 [Vigna angularis var. angularis]
MVLKGWQQQQFTPSTVSTIEKEEMKVQQSSFTVSNHSRFSINRILHVQPLRSSDQQALSSCRCNQRSRLGLVPARSKDLHTLEIHGPETPYSLVTDLLTSLLLWGERYGHDWKVLVAGSLEPIWLEGNVQEKKFSCHRGEAFG